MTTDRRRLLRLSTSVVMASLASPLVTACATAAGSGTATAQTAPPVALLLPLTGAAADVGRSMERAAAMTQPQNGQGAPLILLDTGGSAEGAALAAAQAVQQGAALILGPVFTRELPAVVAAAGGRPVLTFSNDVAAAMAAQAFTLGLTPSQGASAVLAYARERGVRRVALVAGPDDWGRLSAVAARETAARVGLELIELDHARMMAAGPDLQQGLTAAGGGGLPDAVMLTDEGSAATTLGAGLMAAGVQILGPSRWNDEPVSVLDAVEGAWIAAPDPAAFTAFAQTYEDLHRSQPGVLAALAYDAATIARRLQAAGRVSREGLAAREGFQGALGAVRFAPDGRCTRELAVMVVERGELRVVGRAAGT